MNFKNKILQIFNKNTSNNYSDVPKSIIKKFNKTRPIIARKYLCNAPFRNLYFNTDGQVSVCCYNMKYMVGNINKNSITEIWNGKKIKELRKHIANNDLSLGCDACKSELLLSNFESLHIKFYDEQFTIKDYPTSLMFQIDNTCNLECTMCTGDFSSNIFKNREQRTQFENPYNKKFFDELNTYIPHIKECMFSGGEPFLINSYFDIWNKIIETNPSCYISVQTNGTILNDKVKNILEKGKFFIGISLDSLNPELYKKIRVNANLETTLNNIEYFKNYSQTNNRNIRLSTCVMNQNRFEIPIITEFCSKNNLSVEYNTIRFPAKDAVWILNSYELKELIDKYSLLDLPIKTLVQKKNKIKYYDLIKKLKSWYEISIKWEKYIPKPVDESEIKLLQNGIINKLENASLTFNSEDLNINSLILLLNNIFENMPNNDLKYKTLKMINSFSGNKILANIYRENDESLKELINNMVKYSKIE